MPGSGEEERREGKGRKEERGRRRRPVRVDERVTGKRYHSQSGFIMPNVVTLKLGKRCKWKVFV